MRVWLSAIFSFIYGFTVYACRLLLVLIRILSSICPSLVCLCCKDEPNFAVVRCVGGSAFTHWCEKSTDVIYCALGFTLCTLLYLHLLVSTCFICFSAFVQPLFQDQPKRLLLVCQQFNLAKMW